MQPTPPPDEPHRSGNGPFWRGALLAVALVPLLGVGALFAIGALYHDCGEVRAWPSVHVLLTSGRFQEAAQLAGGSFPDGAGEVQRLLAPDPEDALDPWDRPYRYERVGDDGQRARVYTLGRNGVPGGVGCSEDIVWWVDLEDEYWTRDVRELPKAWRTGEGPARSESAGSR